VKSQQEEYLEKSNALIRWLAKGQIKKIRAKLIWQSGSIMVKSRIWLKTTKLLS